MVKKKDKHIEDSKRVIQREEDDNNLFPLNSIKIVTLRPYSYHFMIILRNFTVHIKPHKFFSHFFFEDIICNKPDD